MVQSKITKEEYVAKYTPELLKWCKWKENTTEETKDEACKDMIETMYTAETTREKCLRRLIQNLLYQRRLEEQAAQAASDAAPLIHYLEHPDE